MGCRILCPSRASSRSSCGSGEISCVRTDHTRSCRKAGRSYRTNGLLLSLEHFDLGFRSAEVALVFAFIVISEPSGEPQARHLRTSGLVRPGLPLRAGGREATARPSPLRHRSWPTMPGTRRRSPGRFGPCRGRRGRVDQAPYIVEEDGCPAVRAHAREAPTIQSQINRIVPNYRTGALRPRSQVITAACGAIDVRLLPDLLPSASIGRRREPDRSGEFGAQRELDRFEHWRRRYTIRRGRLEDIEYAA
ncbi:hypothetical protein SAMN05443254_1123 [Bradyrhizobium sp. OK095]|nr:hypothetical protein SAMN05443254_1123 [Bradyrhizobium sp. OK095]